jgi:aspartokinase
VFQVSFLEQNKALEASHHVKSNDESFSPDAADRLDVQFAETSVEVAHMQSSPRASLEFVAPQRHSSTHSVRQSFEAPRRQNSVYSVQDEFQKVTLSGSLLKRHDAKTACILCKTSFRR